MGHPWWPSGKDCTFTTGGTALIPGGETQICRQHDGGEKNKIGIREAILCDHCENLRETKCWEEPEQHSA